MYHPFFQDYRLMFHFGDPIHPAVAGAFSATGNPLLFKVPNDFWTSWVPSSPGHHLRDDTRARALTLRRLSFGRGQGLWLLQNCWDTCGNHLCMYVYIYIFTPFCIFAYWEGHLQSTPLRMMVRSCMDDFPMILPFKIGIFPSINTSTSEVLFERPQPLGSANHWVLR